VERHFQPTVTRFIEAFRRALPDLPNEELLWRIHFMLGTMALRCSGHEPRPGVESPPLDAQGVVPRLVAFLGRVSGRPAAGSEEK